MKKQTKTTETSDPKAEKRRAKRAKRQERIRKFRRRQNSTSLYFLLWAAFSVLSLVIILLFSGVQNVVMEHTYKTQAAQELHEKGKEIREKVVSNRIPEAFYGSWSSYINFLSGHYNVEIYILSGEGEVVFPRNPDSDFKGGRDSYDFTREIAVLLEALEGQSAGYVLYEGDGEYVYGAPVYLFGNSSSENTPLYLYVAKSLALVQSARKQMGVRTALSSVFVFVLAFAASSAVSGWLTRPLAEMTEKARLLAKGDFDVDFRGSNYGAELVQLADSLNFARDELSKADCMQKELIANVSHDFKTPLTMIKAYASMIQEISGEIPEKRNKHAQVIVDEADRLTSLVNDLLDLSKIRSGIAQLKLDVLNMSEYTLEALDRFAYLEDTQGYRFVVDVEDGLYAQADKVKIGQALYNLIGNAVNYTGEDKTVFVSLKRTGESTFRFAVRDTGEGIKPEELAEIWDRYYRSSETHKRPVKGTGLGLSIVKAVLQRHELHFGVESEPGRGSVFFIDFPSV